MSCGCCRVRKAILFDSIVIAALPTDIHQTIASRVKDGSPAERVGLTAGWRTPYPDKDDGSGYSTWLHTVMATTNIHCHSATCRKGVLGATRCCLAFRRADKAEGTGPLHLQKVNTVGAAGQPTGSYQVEQSPLPIPPTDRHVDFNESPLPLPTTTCDTAVVWEVGRKREDQYVVETARSLATATGGNTNVQRLGSNTQAKSAVYYTFKYMQKDANARTISLSILQAALRPCTTHRSVAEDKDTNPLRFAQHVLTRCLNKANSAMEVSSQQAAAALLKLDGFVSSHDFWFCFIRLAMTDVLGRSKTQPASSKSTN